MRAYGHSISSSSAFQFPVALIGSHTIYIYNPFTLDKLVSVDVKHHVYLQSAQSPGEIKRREVSWTLTKKVRLIGGSRRDQEEGGGAGPTS